MFTLGMPLIRRIVRLAKTEKLTSVADFVAARYGKNPAVAAIVALISLVGAIPYIALQLKAVSSSVATMIDTSDYGIGSGENFVDLPLLVTLFLACFAIVFGTRHTDATEHQDGLILAIAMESVVKLVAMLTVGVYIVFVLFGGPADLWAEAQQSVTVIAALEYQTPVARWILMIALSAFGIIMLPRQFHVTVVENRTDNELRTAGILFPLYLIAINAFVLPIAIAGILTFSGSGNADLYLLALPLAGDVPLVTLFTFIGGFSAATAMVIVASVALSIMVSNDIVMPVFLRRRLGTRGSSRRTWPVRSSISAARRSSSFFSSATAIIAPPTSAPASPRSGCSPSPPSRRWRRRSSAVSSGGRPMPAARSRGWSAAFSSGPMSFSCRASAGRTILTSPPRCSASCCPSPISSPARSQTRW